MRDRLIELIVDAENAIYQEKPYSTDTERIGRVADHLLAEGVIVPPMKLGSRRKVYIPIKSTTVVYETKVYGIGIDEDGDMVINPKEYPEEVISIHGGNIGKTVFFIREEAEAALERSKR